jgi:hypothetical protein
MAVLLLEMAATLFLKLVQLLAQASGLKRLQLT